RDLMLHEYTPFLEGTKTVYLGEESTLKFKEEQRVRIDGATALYPVYAGFVQAVYPEDEYRRYDSLSDGGDNDGYGLVTCSNTVYAYERLLEGKTDVIFVAGPSKAQQELAKEKGMELHLTPVGREAFVFFVNSKNPVEGLTVEEVQKIYSGELTNWKEVGGPRWKIKAFQRAENSGSQTALQRLMGEIPIMEPTTEERISAMDGIINQVANYRNYKNAIGFSFRYYSTQMVTNNEIRLLALNGVLPTKETIADGTYPITSEFYAVTASPIGEPAPEQIDDNIAAFLNWVRGPQGQKIVELTGYVPLQ
ncbi:MAG: substrate-binding domain-containing protein, partial [Firmicutes bacterium]|nr:substrate-binding domain-containing protein [Bacillota bacterium]